MIRRRTITFDCYGTLIDTRPIADMIGGIGERHGIERGVFVSAFDAEEVRQMQSTEFRRLGDLVRGCLRHCGEKFAVGSLEHFAQPLLERYRQLEPFVEVVAVLHQLSPQWDLYIMSNSQWDIIDANVRALKTQFKGVFIAEALRCYKPDFRFFRAVAEQLDLGKLGVDHVHVAAGFWWDIIPAFKLGWNRIWVNRLKAIGDSRFQPYVETDNLAGCIQVLEEVA
jgi:2-haloacid dehalogenase